MRALLAWLAAFAFTQAVEVPIYLFALRNAPYSRAQRFGIAFGASAITHPIVWFVIPRLWLGHSYWAMVAGAETFAVLVEAIWIGRFGVEKRITWSFVANMTSVTLGLTCRHYFGWP